MKYSFHFDQNNDQFNHIKYKSAFCLYSIVWILIEKVNNMNVEKSQIIINSNKKEFIRKLCFQIKFYERFYLTLLFVFVHLSMYVSLFLSPLSHVCVCISLYILTLNLTDLQKISHGSIYNLFQISKILKYSYH